MQLIHIHPEKCDNCMRCMRVCPVQAIRTEMGSRHPMIDSDRCIGCGTCYTSCDKGAISYYDSGGEVKSLLKSGARVAAMVDPSISGEFPDITDYRKFVEMIRALGFDRVIDVSFGVDLVARAYKQLFDRQSGKFYIAANCPAMVAFVEKFHPDLIENLAPLVSPMVATAKVVHKTYGSETRTVFIGPCLATKSEARRYAADDAIDAVLTFEELRTLFSENGIHESKLEYSDFDPPQGRLGSLYPISRGLLDAAGIGYSLPDGAVETASGQKHALRAVRSFEKNIDRIQKHFNLFYNEGCVMGPGMSSGGDKHLRNALVEQYTKKRLGTTDAARWQEEIEKYSRLDLQRTFDRNDQRRPEQDKFKVEEVLKLLGKSGQNTPAGCESCGFESCVHFAKAVAQGLTRTDICLDFVIKNKDNYIHTLRESGKKTKEELENRQSDLTKLKAEYELAVEKLETSRAIMNQIPSGVVIVDERLKVLSSNRSFVELLGPEARDIDEIIPGLRGADLKTLVPVQFYKLFQNTLTTGEDILSRDVKIGEALLNLSVFSIKKHKVSGGIVRDMFTPEVRNEQIIRRVTEVIDQNLDMVQQIGFLLGEGASKTEAMLNTIIQLHAKRGERNAEQGKTKG